MSQALVTGGNGYVATQLIAQLLRAGTPVRTTVRSLASEEPLRAAVRRGGADDAGLELVAADLTADDGWKAAVAGCQDVYHVASPLPYVQPKDPDELIIPAREGVLRVLRAACAAGARRIVLTSSFAAIGYTPKPGAEFTEDDWTDPDTPGLAPYPRSKAVAERAAWDLMEREGGDTELVVVNPTFILGPTLTTELRSSLYLVKAMLDGTMAVAPRARFGLADVRDVADLHIRAMAAPDAAGKRFLAVADGPTISYLEIAQTLRRRLGPLAERVPAEEAPGEDLPRPVIHNDRAREELGWRPRSAETTIVDTAHSLRDLGMLAAARPCRAGRDPSARTPDETRPAARPTDSRRPSRRSGRPRSTRPGTRTAGRRRTTPARPTRPRRTSADAGRSPARPDRRARTAPAASPASPRTPPRPAPRPRPAPARPGA
jgi:nucleoside-diphosphate-sugar epimerase